jgi:hypothetical protein
MPCWTIQETKIDLGKVNADILKAALLALGVSSSDYRLSNGKLIMTGSTLTESDVKRAYSKQVVVASAKRFGWGLKERVDGKLVIMKARL